MFGTPDGLTALVLIALSVALLLGLLSYHAPHRGYTNWGIGILVFSTVAALLIGSFDRPEISTALTLMLVTVALMLLLMTYHSRRWAHAVWWLGVLLFFLSLPLLGVGRGDLALVGLIGGPGLLMLVAALHPEVPAHYARLGAMDDGAPLTERDLAAEQNRYTRLAGVITVASLAGVFLTGGVPRREVIETLPPPVIDQALADRGAVLFQQYGCAACHAVTTADPGVGPPLKGLYGRRERLTDGTVVLADEAYIRSSIVEPDAQIVMGYARGVMSSAVAPFMNEIRQEQNIRALVEYVKSLR